MTSHRQSPFGPIQKWGYPDEHPWVTEHRAVNRGGRRPHWARGWWWRRLYYRLTPWWTIAMTPLLLIPIGLATASPAAADPVQDYAYIHTLDVFGVQYSTRGAAITLGLAVCEAFDSGASLNRIGGTIMDGGGYTAPDAGYIVGAAVGAYCNEYAPLIKRSVNAAHIGGVLR